MTFGSFRAGVSPSCCLALVSAGPLLPAGWPLLGWRRTLGGAVLPLGGSPGPPMLAPCAPPGAGGTWCSLLWLLWRRCLFHGDCSRNGVRAAGSPSQAVAGTCRHLIPAGAGGLWRGAWNGWRSHPSVSGWSGCGAGLPLLGCRWSVQSQQAVGLPAAPLRGDFQELTDKCRRVVAEVELHQLD